MRKNGKMMICEMCGKEKYVPLAIQKRFRFCSRVCHAKCILCKPDVQKMVRRKFGKENNRWSGGRTRRQDGYIEITVDGKRRFEHRHVMEQHLGVKLGRDETVHHINHIRDDNRLENLELLSRSEHTLKYHTKKKL